MTGHVWRCETVCTTAFGWRGTDPHVGTFADEGKPLLCQYYRVQTLCLEAWLQFSMFMQLRPGPYQARALQCILQQGIRASWASSL